MPLPFFVEKKNLLLTNEVGKWIIINVKILRKVFVINETRS